MPKKRTRTVITSAERVIGAPPFGVRQPQDRRDERAGVADADEEDEVGDVEAPVDRHVETGHGEAAAQLARVGEDTPRRDQ